MSPPPWTPFCVSENLVSPFPFATERNPSLVGLEIFESGAGVKDNDLLVESDFAGIDEGAQSSETGRAFRRDKKTFGPAHFGNHAKHFVIGDGNRAAAGFAQDFQDKKIADRFRHTQTRRASPRIQKFARALFAGFECEHDRS